MFRINPLKVTAAAALIVATAAHATIDMTPFVSEYKADGMLHAQALFKDGDRTVTIEVPDRWSCRGSATRLQLTPPAPASFAEGVVEIAQLQAPQRLDEATMKAFEERTLASLPPGSQGVTVVSRNENPVLINGSVSYEVVVTYQALGTTFQRTAILVNAPEWQMSMRFTAEKRDFDPLARAFVGSMRSWQWNEPKSPQLAAN